MMRIGIDIDDTLVITINSMIKYADKYDTSILGRKGTNGNLGLIQNRYYLKVLYGWTVEEKFKFFDMYYKNILEECTLLPNADKVCQKLKSEGNELFFITARLIGIVGCNTEEITKKTLLEHNIPYDELIINASDKLKICQEKQIDLFIEDSYETCVELSKVGIKAILMTTKMNEKIDSGEIVRVNNWDEIYEEINKISNNS
jgi:uncharacterized HAD superfamily protein